MKLKSLVDTKGKDCFYIMHLSYGKNNRRNLLWNYAKKNNIVGLDLPYIVEDDWNKVKELAKERGISRIWEKQFEIFYNEMGKDDIVVILAGWDSILGVAKVDDEYPEYNEKIRIEEEFFEHFRKVRWLKAYNFDNCFRLRNPVKGFNNTLQKVKQGSKWWTSLVTTENLP